MKISFSISLTFLWSDLMINVKLEMKQIIDDIKQGTWLWMISFPLNATYFVQSPMPYCPVINFAVFVNGAQVTQRRWTFLMRWPLTEENAHLETDNRIIPRILMIILSTLYFSSILNLFSPIPGFNHSLQVCTCLSSCIFMFSYLSSEIKRLLLREVTEVIQSQLQYQCQPTGDLYFLTSLSISKITTLFFLTF